MIKLSQWRWWSLVIGLALLPAYSVQASRVITDLAGRQVSVPDHVSRVILGEGRLLYTLAALQPENPFAHVVGWRGELIEYDADTWALYRAHFPQAADLPIFGKAAAGEFSVEQALALKPQVIIFDRAAYAPLRAQRALDLLEAAGVTVVFVDFLTKPDQHMAPSIRVMGQLFEAEERASALIQLRQQALAAVAERLPEQRPRVLIETAAGLHDCCRSVGDDNLGRVIRLAGGDNIATQRIPGVFGTLSPEWVLVNNPDVVIMTGGDWQQFNPKAIPMGYGASSRAARQAMQALVSERPGWSGLRAVRDGRVYALWHQFYNTPYQFVAIQQVAKWLHPEAMADLQPDALWQQLHHQFLPVPMQGAFWASIAPTLSHAH